MINTEVVPGLAGAVDAAPAVLPPRPWAIVAVLFVGAILVLGPPGIAFLALAGVLR